tara:strand:+ start:121 stop:504 length:384 start_codon:yes stop_codon:yes gene_type:complete
MGTWPRFLKIILWGGDKSLMQLSEKYMCKEIACLVLGLSLFVGCGGGEKVIRVAPPSSTNQLRDVLKQIADAGMIDSSIEYAKELVDKAVKADPGKAGLEQSVYELERAQGKKAISKKVEEMLKMLE